mmetsp:Transcript_25111/g.72626  ORF Transcript_25111/g.72626 Transcript_25111/m.72626 type:complete len:140 (+) Transcript_25111:81-500(+)
MSTEVHINATLPIDVGTGTRFSRNWYHKPAKKLKISLEVNFGHQTQYFLSQLTKYHQTTAQTSPPIPTQMIYMARSWSGGLTCKIMPKTAPESPPAHFWTCNVAVFVSADEFRSNLRTKLHPWTNRTNDMANTGGGSCI